VWRNAFCGWTYTYYTAFADLEKEDGIQDIIVIDQKKQNNNQIMDNVLYERAQQPTNAEEDAHFLNARSPKIGRHSEQNTQFHAMQWSRSAAVAAASEAAGSPES